MVPPGRITKRARNAPSTCLLSPETVAVRILLFTTVSQKNCRSFLSSLLPLRKDGDGPFSREDRYEVDALSFVTVAPIWISCSCVAQGWRRPIQSRNQVRSCCLSVQGNAEGKTFSVYRCHPVRRYAALDSFVIVISSH